MNQEDSNSVSDDMYSHIVVIQKRLFEQDQQIAGLQSQNAGLQSQIIGLQSQIAVLQSQMVTVMDNLLTLKGNQHGEN